ncbi:MAG TPA: hypothetical protein VGF25_13885 [Thermoleophilaceae bacterium]|jgi:hypothetical protein
MRKVFLGGALVCALSLAITGTAFATTTTMNASMKASPAKAGTKKKPRPTALTLGIEGGTTTGTGQPAPSTRLKVMLPKGFVWNGKLWAKKARCSVSDAVRKHSASACPAKSKIGKGHVTALASNGNLVEELDVTAFVTTTGDLGLFLKGDSPLPIGTMIVGKVKGRTIDVAIPLNVQEPVSGVKSGIKTLKFTLNGKTKVKGKSRGILETTSCSGGKWTGQVTNILQDGSLTQKVSTPCHK